MKVDYEKIKRKYNEYVRIVLRTVCWKRPDSIDAELDFLNDIDAVAQKYGYKAVTFGENENKRAIMFEKI